MEDYKTMFNKIKNEHVKIRENVKLVGDSINDQEALRSLIKLRADWNPSKVEILSEKQRRLQQTLAFLDEGLQNHFSIEARYLPPFAGELFMRALLSEHREIERQIDEAKLIAFDTNLDGLTQDELLSKETHVHQIVDGLCQKIEEHSSKEEILLRMLEKGLQESGRI